jgi:alkanesulfonate monooxygenase SsuD/methylene tetrahydromethanopterin reductase-like flavin-dependent oxidoreductase (luciferase family)
VKVFVDLTRFMATASRSDLTDQLKRLEDLGVTGVTVWDHLFTSGDLPRAERAHADLLPADPITALALIAGASSALELHTAVVNTAWMHPALVLRQFAQIAVLAGGHRVTAGLGAGWNTEEFDAIGMKMAPFRERTDRLEETLRLARDLFHHKVANFEGDYISVRDLPLSPVPDTPPRILVAGGSDRVCQMAGRYADVLNIYGHPRHGKVVGKTNAERHRGDTQRRSYTTIDDAAERMSLARASAVEAGRQPDDIKASVHILFTVYGSAERIQPIEAQICRTYGQVDPISLADNPYFLFGEPGQIAETLLDRQERFGLDEICFQEHNEVPGAEFDLERFCRDVVPRLG